MHIFSAAQIREWDAYTIAREPVSSADLMERAGRNCMRQMIRDFPQAGAFHIFCGPGNNGGDGLVIARCLHQQHRRVAVYISDEEDKYTPDFLLNLHRLKKAGILPLMMDKLPVITDIAKEDVVVDAFYGSGLNRPVTGKIADLILSLNNTEARRIAIDMPSGLPADNSPKGVVFCAHLTYTLQSPKLSLMHPSHYTYTGEWKMIPIGLHPGYLPATATPYHYVTAEMAEQLLIRPGKFDHKGTRGHSLLIAGSTEKAGAAILAARACLRAGSGLVTIHTTPGVISALQASLPEAMGLCSGDKDVISSLPALTAYSSIGAGPGMGTNPLTAQALYKLLETASTPLVLDADALNIIARDGMLGTVPAGAILTPHPREFQRLAGTWKTEEEKIEKLLHIAGKYHLYIALKGAHTALATPDGHLFFNSSGTPAMATAGSGDVLTGILTALLARGHKPEDAAILGIYLHGRAGQLAAERWPNIIASDIADSITYATL